MPTTFKPLSRFAPELGQESDFSASVDPSVSFIPAADFGSPRPDSGPSGLFVYGDSGAIGSSSSTGTAGLTPPAPITVTTAGSSLAVHIIWESSVASAPAAFTAGIIAAVQSYEAKFTNAVTIDIDVGYGTIAGGNMGSGALGESATYLQYVSYSSLVAALTSHSTDATDASVIASLPGSAPVSGYIWLTTAQAKALGLAAANGTGLDGYIGLASSYAFTYNSSGVAANTYDFNAVISHELTEVMGRLMLTGGSIGPYANSYSLLDLLHYSAPGVRDLSASKPGYLSVDGGVTNGGTFNTVAGGDSADWASSMGNNAYDAFSSAGVVNGVTRGDDTELNALGWTLASNAAPTPAPAPPIPARTISSPPIPALLVPTPSPPGAVAIAAATGSLAVSQGSAGLNANTPLAVLTAVGGVAGNPTTYTLGGASAGSFVLSASGNSSTLSVGAAGLAGGTNGTVYALTLAATDTVTGLSSTPSAFDIVVANGGNDVVSVAALVGAASKATPMFIYGLAGNDTLNASGITGKLWIDGGAGADTMTGGSGPNRYLYNATSDSTASAMDIVTNFSPNKDFLDLTGIGGNHLTYVGNFQGNKLAANSIGIRFSGFNTFVYVNTSGSAESLTATNMKIDLAGWLGVGSNNILHA